MHIFSRADHKAHALLQADPETGHAVIGNGHFAALTLFEEHGYHRSAAAHHIAIPHAGEAHIAPASVGVGLDDELFGGQFGGAVQVDGVDRFISAESNHTLHTHINGGVNNIAAA
ncbi:hypothetical protein SDC9_174084 [bioreactor metagenome]|uniref:Uncharacterized protein n=1 Tax=bioreactor metagenome TaxID=1076179 RepID=A0A645GLC7_9ZZZZ